MLSAAGIFLKLSKFSLFKYRIYYLGLFDLPGKLAASGQANEFLRRVPLTMDDNKPNSLVWIQNSYLRLFSQYLKVAPPLNGILKKAASLIDTVRLRFRHSP